MLFFQGRVNLSLKMQKRERDWGLVVSERADAADLIISLICHRCLISLGAALKFSWFLLRVSVIR